MKSLFLTTNPLNFNIFQVALDTERAIWENRTNAGIPTSRDNFRIHEGDVKTIILALERNDLVVVPKDILKQLLEERLKAAGRLPVDGESPKQEGGE